mmetsp:Transcript_4196/g.12257  ORF Transcript_4196/g.12257 Transcript_4196/m.12257 type:complete len:308 (+) Transcript_4196:220-1143(+)
MMPGSNLSGNVLAKLYTMMRPSCMMKPKVCRPEMTSESTMTPAKTIIASLTTPARMKATAELCFTKRAMTTLRQNATHEFMNRCPFQSITVSQSGTAMCSLGWTQIRTASIMERKTAQRGITSITYVSASSFFPALERSMACSTIFVHSKSWLDPWKKKPVQEKKSSPWIVRAVANTTSTRMLALRQWNFSRATAREKVYTRARLASFIICRNATEECRYAVLLRASWPAKKIAMGRAPLRMRSLSTATFLSGSVSDGNSEGKTRYRSPAMTEQKIAWHRTKGTAYGKRPSVMRNLLYEIRPAEVAM